MVIAPGKATLLTDVPGDDRDKIEAALRAKGLPVNTQNILRLYNAKGQ